MCCEDETLTLCGLRLVEGERLDGPPTCIVCADLMLADYCPLGGPCRHWPSRRRDA
jgi:hypothetical protein